MPNQPPSPLVARIAGIARSLGELSADVVFIGGALAPLLQTHPAISRVRATKDVDAVIASTNYTGHNTLETKLRKLGFKLDMSDTHHAHHWLAPDGTPSSPQAIISAALEVSGIPWRSRQRSKSKSSPDSKSDTRAHPASLR